MLIFGQEMNFYRVLVFVQDLNHCADVRIRPKPQATLIGLPGYSEAPWCGLRSVAIDLKPRKSVIYALRGRLAWPKVSHSGLLTEQVNARSPVPPTLSPQFRRRCLRFPGNLRQSPAISVGGPCLPEPVAVRTSAWQSQSLPKPVPRRARTYQKQWQSEKDVRLRKKWLVLLLKFCNFAGMKF